MSRKPDDDEIEISIFGPGYGESILLHLGLDYWAVIDSCPSFNSSEPAPLRYLRSVGVDPAESVRLILATHWHDDHIRGISDIFSVAKNAKFFCSAALRSREFTDLVCLSQKLMTDDPGTNEFSKVMRVLEERGGRQRKASIGPEFVIAGQIMARREPPLPFELHALSPSSASLNLAFHEIKNSLENATAGTTLSQRTKRRIVAQEPNHVAIALWLKMGDRAVLLGSDLEETANASTGWTVIADSSVRPPGKADVFKVAHHGSDTAHQPRVWDEMLEAAPIAALTPFINGRLLIPSASEAQRILSYTPHAYITSPVKTKRTKWANKTVEKTINETVLNIYEVPQSTGQVRLRRKHSQGEASWNVELLGSACELQFAHR
ncbi:hypothetical protein FBQ96_06455 [Nitrospirales bacterium NOB]|nr:hypothetical protein [Nitrospirales bacterium NOB]